MGEERYEFSKFILQKMGDRNDPDNLARIIKAVQFKYSNDGVTWTDHLNGQWVLTGQTKEVGKDEQLYIDIDPPIEAVMIRIVMDFHPDHFEMPASRVHHVVKGRFDLIARKLDD